MPQILLIGDSPSDDARLPLEAAGFPVTACHYGGIDPGQITKSQLVILEVTPQTATTAQALCRRWRIELGELYVPFIWLCFDSSPALLTGALDSGADTCLPRPFAPTQLLAQAKALLRVQHMNARLMSRAAEAQQINQRLQQAYQQIDNDMEMARRIHRGFMPRTLPEVQQASFAVCYRPRSRIGGDFYDVQRLDENHCAVYVADAMGRGLPTSSLLSIFVKKSLQLKEISGRSYRLVPPAEVLSRLNRDLVGLGLPEPSFVTMLYLQLNCRDGSLCFSRASHPHPLYVPKTGEPEYWSTTGTLVGVFEAEFTQHNQTLKSGDRVLLMSDGVPTSASGSDRLVESVRRHRAETLQAFVDGVAHDLLESSRNTEDFTLLGIEYR
jgi:sigma-B regulation protein RsbU (phosphoserine phosphatase)